MTSKQEAMWVLRAQCGDREAFELLLRHVQPSLRAYIAAIVGSTDADDVVQEVLLQIYRKLAWLDNPELFRHWAFRIASRAGRRHAEKRRRWSDRVEDEAVLDEFAVPSESFGKGRIRDLLIAHQISPGSTAVLMLHFEEDMTLTEVAAILELPLGTVKSRLAYGLAALRRSLHTERNK